MIGCNKRWQMVTSAIFAKSGRINGRTVQAMVSDQVAPDTILKISTPGKSMLQIQVNKLEIHLQRMNLPW